MHSRLLHRWYERDDNAVPAVFRLRPVSTVAAEITAEDASSLLDWPHDAAALVALLNATFARQRAEAVSDDSPAEPAQQTDTITARYGLIIPLPSSAWRDGERSGSAVFVSLRCCLALVFCWVPSCLFSDAFFLP